MWLAFLLYSSVDFVFKLFEGYYFPFFLKIPLQYLQYLLQHWHLRAYYKYTKLINRNAEEGNSKKDNDSKIMDRLEKDAKRQLLAYEISGPIDGKWKSFLPTTFGNILLASELYPYEKYRLNGAMFFPRMSMIFPPEFVSALEEKNNQIVFILNSSLLAYLTGILGVLIGSIGLMDGSQWPDPLMVSLQWLKSILQPGYIQIKPGIYLLLGALIGISGYLIYRISINAVKEYALFIRTSFDLYRFKALRELNHPVPLSLDEEKLVWEAISEYLISGDRFGEINFYYQLKQELDPQLPEKKKRFSLFSLFRQ